jgi:large subunit ribosomal protein L17
MAVIEFVDRDTSAKGAGDRARIEAEGTDADAAAA